MGRYKLGKPQIKRLLEDKPVMDGHGRKLYANDEVKRELKMIHDNNLYDKFDVNVEGCAMDIVLKEGDKPNFMHTYNTFRVTSREGDYGYIGVLHPRTQNAIDKRLNIVCLEVDFGLLSSKEGYYKKAKVPSKFQSVNFDVSVLIPVAMKYGELEQILNKYKSKIVNGYTLKEIYENEALGNNKSVTVSYELSGKDHTLEGKEIDEFLTNLVSHLSKNKLAIRN